MNVEIVEADRAKVALPPMEGRVERFLAGKAATLWEGKIDGKTVCVWGMVPPTIMSDQAYIWLYTNDELVREHQFVFVRRSQRMIEQMLEEYPRIVGHCLVDSPRSIRWLKWLGATFGPPSGMLVPFEIRKKHG